MAERQTEAAGQRSAFQAMQSDDVTGLAGRNRRTIAHDQIGDGGTECGTIDFALRFYLSALKEADIAFSPHLVLRQRAPRGSSTRRRTATTKPKDDLTEEKDEPVIPNGIFEVPFRVLGIEGHAYLPDEITTEQWETINEYVKFIIGHRQKAQTN